MIDEIRELLDGYIAWLKDRTTLRQASDRWVEITTPYLDRHNDYLQIYVKREDGGFVLTDDGATIEDLRQCGCKLESPRRQDLLRMTLAGFGVQNNEGRLEVRASPESFPLRKHNLVQAILAVNDLFCLAGPVVTSLFYEDVVAWLDAAEIRYTTNVRFTGRSGFDHQFDFVIPRSRRQPERIIQAVTHPDKNMAETIAFRWFDTREVRPPGSRAYAILNDQEHRVAQAVLDALRSYEVRPVVWSEREQVQAELAA